jgi:hypothetical protein
MLIRAIVVATWAAWHRGPLTSMPPGPSSIRRSRPEPTGTDD